MMHQKFMLSWEAFIEFFDLCCMGRCKAPKPPPPRPAYQIIGQIETWTRPRFGPPPCNIYLRHSPDLSELSEDELLAQMRAELEDEWESDFETEQEEEKPEVYIIMIDQRGNERRINL